MQAFKSGPDYIDPMFHKKVLGTEGGNLDLFFSGEDGVRCLLAEGMGQRDIAIVEGAMGYYDGIGMTEAAWRRRRGCRWCWWWIPPGWACPYVP